jgi:hypothetical protein
MTRRRTDFLRISVSNAPIFAGWHLQPDYTSTTPYLPFCRKCHRHKRFTRKALVEYRKRCTGFNARFTMKEEPWEEGCSPDSMHEDSTRRGTAGAVTWGRDAVFPASGVSDSILVVTSPSGWTRNGL